MSYYISVFIGNHKNTTNGEVHCYSSFDELASEFDSCSKGGKHSAYFVRGKLNPIERKNQNLQTSNLLIIDADSANSGKLIPPLEVHEKLKELGYNHFIYTTHSHNAEQNKYRVVIDCMMYTALELKHLNSKILTDLDCNIKYVKEMNSWTQPWFIPTRDDPTDGLFEYYKFTDGKVFEYEQDKGERQAEGNTFRDSEVGGNTLDDMYENIRTGNEFHESTRTISYQLIKDGVPRAHVEAILTSLYNGSSAVGSDRWQERFNDIPRLVQGAVDRISADEAGDWDVRFKHDGDEIFPILPKPPGLFGKLCDISNSHMLYQHPELSYMAAAGVLAAICGRKFNYTFGFHPVNGQPSKPTGLNLYMTIVGSTGVGKSGLETFAKNVFHMDGSKNSFLGSSKFTGAKALVDTMRDKRLSMLSVNTEAGLTLKNKTGDQAGLMQCILDMYGWSGCNQRSNTTSFSNVDNNIMEMRAPALTLLSESVPGTLMDAFKDTDALNSGLIPRQTLLVIPENRPVVFNEYATDHIPDEVKNRLLKLMEVSSQVQAVDDPKCVFITFGDDKMRNEARKIREYLDEKRSTESAEGIMSGRMNVKFLKQACLCAIFNQGLSAVKDNTLGIDWDSWDWAKKMLNYEEQVARIFLDRFAGSDDINEAVDVVIYNLKLLLTGKHTSASRQKMVTKAHQAEKVVSITVLRDVLAKNSAIRALNSDAKQHNIKTGLDKVLEYLEKRGDIKILDKHKLSKRKGIKMIKVMEVINE